MPSLFLQSARIGGSVSPSWVRLLSLVTRVRQLSVSRDSLMPCLIAYLMTMYRTYIDIAKPATYAKVTSTISWKASRRIATSNCIHSMGVPPGSDSAALSASQVCDAEYRSAKYPVRPSASQESAPRPLRAPRAVKAQGGTRNAAEWQQILLHLTDYVVNP